MNKRMTFLGALLAVGLLMPGCSVGTPLAIGPATDARIDAELEDEWDEDAPNWAHPDDQVTTPPSGKPASGSRYCDSDDGQSDDEWDEDAPNWRHGDES